MSSLPLLFATKRGQPIQVHLDRTVTQYSNIGPIKEPVVITSGDGDKITSVAGRVLRESIPALLKRCIDAPLTAYLDFEVVNLIGDRPRTALLDISGHLERFDGSVLTMRSRTIKGTGARRSLDPARVLFFHRDEPITGAAEADSERLTVANGNLTLELVLEHKGRSVYTYIPADEVLFVDEAMAIELVS